MDEFVLNGATYSFGKLDAMRSFHVMRRIMPVLAQLGVTAAVVQQLSEADVDDNMIGESLAPIMHFIGSMKDEDVEYVIKSCLSVVKRQQNDRWAPVQSASGGLMFADIEMDGMIRLTVECLKRNLSSFFKVPLVDVKP